MECSSAPVACCDTRRADGIGDFEAYPNSRNTLYFALRLLWVDGLALLVLALVCWPVDALSAPLHVTGFLGYEYRFDEYDDGKQRMENSKLLGLTTSVPVWKPWFAQLTTGVQLRFSDVNQDEGDYNSRFVTGEARLRLFPVSHFPFEVYFERRHDQLDSSDILDTNSLSTRYGIRQHYLSTAGTRYSAHLEHSERHSERSDGSSEHKQISDIANLGASRSLGDHSVLFDYGNSRYRDGTRSQVLNRSYTSFRHRYSPGERFVLNGQVAYRENRIDRETRDFGLYRSEWSEFVVWNPDTVRSLSVSGGLRLVHSGLLFDDSGSRDTVSARIGSRFALTDNWQIGADANVSQTHDDSGSESSGRQSANARFNSDSRRIGEFDYSWFTAFEAGNEHGSNSEDLQYGEFRIGHELAHYQLGFDSSPWRVRFGQELAMREDTQDLSEQLIIHVAGVSRSWSGVSGSTFFALSLSDNRTFRDYDRHSENTRDFQFISAQLSRDQRLNRDSTLTGQAFLQVARYANYFDSHDREYQPSASVDITYRHQRLFGIPRMRFTSTLRLFSDSYLPLVDELEDEDDFEGSSWENRLQYVIGQLDFLLLTRVSEIRERDRGVVFFQVRRHFDRYVN